MTETTGAHLTTDLVVTAEEHVLLIRRDWPPHQGRLALPGGYVDTNERFHHAAVRELGEETGLDTTSAELKRIGIYDHPDRDPRGRVISVAYHLALPRRVEVEAGDDARDAAWHPISALRTADLAFDHAHILRDAGLT